MSLTSISAILKVKQEASLAMTAMSFRPILSIDLSWLLSQMFATKDKRDYSVSDSIVPFSFHILRSQNPL